MNPPELEYAEVPPHPWEPDAPAFVLPAGPGPLPSRIRLLAPDGREAVYRLCWSAGPAARDAVRRLGDPTPDLLERV